MSKLLLPYKFKGITMNIKDMYTAGRRLSNRHVSTFYLGDCYS